MARYTGPAWKLSRRLGISLSGTGKELEKRPYAPGPHGPNQRKKLSEYGLQLQERHLAIEITLDALSYAFPYYPP
ncbi:hypothetical protein ACT4UM_26985, partial [Bacillus sp. SS-TM]